MIYQKLDGSSLAVSSLISTAVAVTIAGMLAKWIRK